MSELNQATRTAFADRQNYCAHCWVAPVDVAGSLCPNCALKPEALADQQTTQAVDELLAKHDLSREQVSTMGASADIPVTPEEDEAFAEKAAATHWVDELANEHKASEIEPAPNASLLPDTKMIEQSFTMAKVNTKTAGENVTTDLVPEMGSVLSRIDSTALAFGFPPAVDALIKKTQLMPEAAKDLLGKFKDLFILTGQMRSRLDAVNPQSVDDTAAIAEAKELHRILRDERLNAEKRKKIIKEPYLRPSQLIDGIFKIWVDEIGPMEKEAKYKAEYVENLERERKAKLAAERTAKLALFEVTEVQGFNLGEISDAAFDVIYQGAMSSYQARKAEEQREREAQAERERLAEIERQRLVEENQRLARERAEAEARATEERRVADEERRQKEAAEAELARQEELRKAEERRIAAETEARRLAPDRDKLLLFADEIEKLVVPEVDAKFAGLISQIEERLISTAKFVRENVDKA